MRVWNSNLQDYHELTIGHHLFDSKPEVFLCVVSRTSLSEQ